MEEKAKKTGRPSTFTDDVAEEICIRIACGEALAAICRDAEMPEYRTVMRWLSANDGFRHKYARAREDQGNADADAVTDIGQRVLKGELDPQAARVAIDALKWSAAKRQPKKYGDKVAVGGWNGGPVQSLNIDPATLKDMSDDELAALERALGRIEGGSASNTGGNSGEEGEPQD